MRQVILKKMLKVYPVEDSDIKIVNKDPTEIYSMTVSVVIKDLVSCLVIKELSKEYTSLSKGIYARVRIIMFYGVLLSWALLQLAKAIIIFPLAASAYLIMKMIMIICLPFYRGKECELCNTTFYCEFIRHIVSCSKVRMYQLDDNTRPIIKYIMSVR